MARRPMPRTLNRLSALKVTKESRPGMYADGAGLYLRVRGPTVRSWVFVWHDAGKRREMGLGAPPHVGLARAREKAQECRDIRSAGGDPLAVKRSLRPVPTFGDLADEFIKDNTASVRSDKSIARWKRCIGQGGYADSLRSLPVDKVTTENVLDVLKPLWTIKAATAGDLRGYIERVLNRAKASGFLSGENPAAWTNHLEMILPKQQRLTRGHHPAMPYGLVPDFMKKLRAKPSVAAKALELTILCATRTSETLGAEWQEIDFDQKLWTIPAGRMKAHKEHRIPLSDAAITVLEALPTRQGPVFPGRGGEKPLSNMSMDMVLRRIDDSVTVHGFRSTFRDWTWETTETPREIAEAALAHTVGSNAELAYRRGDALEKRRDLMTKWAKFCAHAS